MRRALALLLLICVGILIPAGAVPLRLCVLEGRIATLDSVRHSAMEPEAVKCCNSCEREPEKPQSCCFDLDQLPESTPPMTQIELPAPVGTDLGGIPWITPKVVFREDAALPALPELRVPRPPGEWRAMLAVWRL